MKDKMVLSCLKLNIIVLSPKNKVCSHSQCFKCLRQFEKMHFEKIVQQNEETVSTEKILY